MTFYSSCAPDHAAVIASTKGSGTPLANVY
jgi:hypothetical protein